MNKRQPCRLTALALTYISVVAGQTPAKLEDHAATTHHIVVPLTAWNPGGVVSGNPNKPGEAFVIRIANDRNQIVPPHWHPEDEHLVVVKGTWYVGTGEVFDRNAMKEMNVGDYMFMPKKMAHFGWAKTDVIVQVHGIGPFKVIPVDEWQFVTGWKWMLDGSVQPDPEAVSAFKWKPNDRVRSKSGVGVVLSAARSARNKVTQYQIEGDNGVRFMELEEELSAVAQEKRSDSGPLTGTWACVARDTPAGDLNSTLYMQQDERTTTGVISWQNGGAAFTSSASRPDAIEFRFDSVFGAVVNRAEYRDSQLAGEWSIEGGPKGSLNCRRAAK